MHGVGTLASVAVTARFLLWAVALAVFVVFGLKGLEARRIDYEGDPLGFRRTTTDPAASQGVYLAQFNLSVLALEQAIADVPVDEPIVFVHRDDASMFQEYSILSYSLWPRRLYVAVCASSGEVESGMLTPPTETVKAVIVDMPTPPAAAGSDSLQQIAPTAWLVRSPVGRAWTSFCQ
jgi:hypothetical protein